MLSFKSVALIAALLFVVAVQCSLAGDKLENEIVEDDDADFDDEELDGGFNKLKEWYAHDFQEDGTPDYNKPRSSPCAKKRTATDCATCCQEMGMAGNFRVDHLVMKKCSCAYRHSLKSHPL